MPEIRDSVWYESAGGSASAVISMPDMEPNDTCVIIVGGGNRVTGWDDDTNRFWKYFEYSTGEEAQGIVLFITASRVDMPNDLTINFDGTDPHSIMAVSVSGICEVSFPLVERDGDAGETMEAGDGDTAFFGAGAGDVLLSFAFTRNAAGLPSVQRGDLVGSTDGVSTAAGWTETIPGPVNTTQRFDYPERSGHFGAVVQLWDWSTRTAVLHEYEVVTTFLRAGSVWDPETHTLTAPPAAGVQTFEFGLRGDFRALPVVGLRIDQEQIYGDSYLNMAFDSADGEDPSGYFAVDSSTIWMYPGSYSIETPLNVKHRIDRAYFNNDDFSVERMVTRSANEEDYLHGYGTLYTQQLSGSETTFRVFAFEEPEVTALMNITGQLDETRARIYRKKTHGLP